MRNNTWKLAAIGLLAVGLGASACTKNEDKVTDPDKSGGLKDAKLVYVDDAKAPAPEISGAKKGGVLKILGSADFDHFDPQATYRGDAIMVGGQLALRTLTNYYEVDGKIKLMGDLATNTGVQSDGCKTFTYTLRDGIKFEDGTPITSKDIAYGISRAFDEGEADGPTYIQTWLAGKDWATAYTGPFKNPGTIAPGITTPDDKTIVFKMAEAHCSFPLAAALPTTVPVPAAKDGGPGKYESPVASGPYKIKSYTRGEKLVFEKNPNWDPASDPLRHQYVDGYEFDWTAVDPDVVTKRVVADQGDDKNIIMWDNPSTVGVADIDASADAKSRVIEGDTVFSIFLNMNTQRIKNVDLRRAMIYAYNKQALLQIIGGEKAGTPSTTLVPPVTPGYKKFDIYNVPLAGDPAKAKEYIEKAKAAGETLRPYKYCYRAGALRPKTAAAAKENFAKAGIELVLTELDRTTYYNIVGKKDTDCDLIPGGWGQDYPDDETFLGILASADEANRDGSNNNAYFDNADVDKKLKEYGAMPDRAAAGKLYGDLEESIFKDFAPWIPLYYDHSYSINGSGVGGVYLSQLWGSPSLQNAYVK